jgi:PDZ domain-containing secreted protein
VIGRVVSGSPAETAGLLADDVIVSVDGDAIDSAEALSAAVEAHAPGDVIAVVVTRDGSEETFDVELGTAPTRERGDRDDLLADADVEPLVKAERVLHVDLDEVDGGYEVLAGRMRAESVLQVGDVITAVNGTAVQDVDWAALVTELTASDSPTLTLTVLRDGEETAIELTSIGGQRGHGPMGERGRPGRGGADPAAPGSDSDDAGRQTEVAPHPVEEGVACTTCHGDSQTTSPALPNTGTL